jgi:dihydrolipoamide dehydrogenase
LADQHFNVVFLGGGSGGYVGAIRAAQLGMNVAVVERDKLGGTCLHRGCIPSKAYLESAQVFTEFQHRESFGLTADNIGYDFAGIQKQMRKVVTDNWNGVKFLMKKNKITVIEGDGRVSEKGKLVVKNAKGEVENVTTDNLVIGTGTRPRTLGIPIDGKRIFTSDNVWEATSMPVSVIILGGGVIGCEFAAFYSAFGVECTVIEMLSGLLPMMDEDAGKELQRAYSKRGVKILTGARALPESVRSTHDGVEVDIEVNGKRETCRAEHMLVAIAREAVTDGLGLEEIGVDTDHGFVKVGENQRTNVANVYGIGDVIGGFGLAHKAFADGILAAESIAGKNVLASIDPNRIPQPVFSSPQAAIGITEKEARETGVELEVGKFPFTANPKAKILNDAVGFTKVVADKKTGEILGVTMVGPNVTELIAEAALGKFIESTPWELAYNIHPHPTLSEALGEAAHAAEGSPIHM